jgi:hypothetical protein
MDDSLPQTATCFALSNLKRETADFSETLVPTSIYQTT